MVSKPIADRAITFAITDTKLHVPVIALSTQDNTKLNEQLKAITIKKNHPEQISIKRINAFTKSVFRLLN